MKTKTPISALANLIKKKKETKKESCFYLPHSSTTLKLHKTAEKNASGKRIQLKTQRKETLECPWTRIPPKSFNVTNVERNNAVDIRTSDIARNPQKSWKTEPFSKNSGLLKPQRRKFAETEVSIASCYDWETMPSIRFSQLKFGESFGDW